MKQTINVTQRDINKSKSLGFMGGMSCGCPIWQATQRVKRLQNYEAGIFALFSCDGFGPDIPLPEKASKLSILAHGRKWSKIRPLKFTVDL